MKLRNFLLLLLGLVSSLAFSGCKDDEASGDNLSSALQQYKWVCEYSDHSVEIGLSDYYTITLYFVNDSECLVRNYHKRYDVDSSPHYSSEEECETIQYAVNGDQITFSKSKFIQYNEAYSYIVSAIYWHDFLYEKQAITSSDQSYINEHYTPRPTPSPEGMSFMGLKAVGDTNYFKCDKLGRLVAYGTDGKISRTYEYSNNRIVSKSGDGVSEWIYQLENGLVTSWTYSKNKDIWYTVYVKYDSDKRIIQTTEVEDDEDIHQLYKWDKSGNLYEGGGFKYEYLSSKCVFPLYFTNMEHLQLNIDGVLVLEGYFGNSIPRNNIKSRSSSAFDDPSKIIRKSYNYQFDSKGRPTEVYAKQEVKLGSYEDTSEGTTYYVWE